MIEAAGQLLSLPFVDAHFHMDATLSVGLRVNESGTLLEGIALWGELKPQRRSRRWSSVRCSIATGRWPRACWRSARTSTCDDERLLAVEALLHVRERVKPYLDLQLVAFPQDGCCAPPTRART